jgi:hypothetical protein
MLTQQWQGEWPGVDGVVESQIIVDQQRLTGGDHQLAIERKHIAAASRPVAAASRLLLPHGVFALVKDVLRLRKRRHPFAIAQHRVPPGVVDVQMGAEYLGFPPTVTRKRTQELAKSL